MINITLDQAATMIDCIEGDIDISRFGETDYTDVNALRYCLNRAELLQHLKAAIAAEV
jgi:hypothetical protein